MSDDIQLIHGIGYFIDDKKEVINIRHRYRLNYIELSRFMDELEFKHPDKFVKRDYAILISY
jgi:hypothetical protein